MDHVTLIRRLQTIIHTMLTHLKVNKLKYSLSRELQPLAYVGCAE